MEDNETFIQRVEDLYISDNHNYVRREEARRLRQRKRSNFSNFAPFGTEMPPVKVQRQEDPSAEVLKEASAVEEQLANLDDASKEETEMKDEMKEEKLDVEKAEEAEREHAEAVAAAQEAMEAEVDAAEAEAAAAEAAAAAAQLAEENLEVETEAHEESHEATEAAGNDTFADEAMLQAVPEVAKTEGDEAREEKILEDCELVVEATDHLLQKVDAEEQPEEAPWEIGNGTHGRSWMAEDILSSCDVLWLSQLRGREVDDAAFMSILNVTDDQQASVVIPGELALGSFKSAIRLAKEDSNVVVVNCAGTKLHEFLPATREPMDALREQQRVYDLEWEDSAEAAEEEMDDGLKEAKALELLCQALLWAQEQQKKGKMVMVNCAQGRSRSAKFTIAYLMASCDVAMDEAYGRVKKATWEGDV
eukprot:symbB.v1.2.000174.t3/scaffold9.1/size550961/30